jgi:ankyrin repeat protein
MNLSPPPPQDDDPIITQFRPLNDQWELNGDNITRIDHETGCTILHNYCKHINTVPLEMYRYLIETKDCDVITKDKYNDTPLHYVIRYFNPNNGGNITVLRYLLNQKNVNVDIKGEYGHTLLHSACRYINTLPIDVFKLLIETLGFDVNARDNSNNIPLHCALDYFDPNRGGDITVLTYLLNQNGGNGNIEACFGETLLHTACRRINTLPLDVFKVLIETMSCNINAQNKKNDTPLHYAIYNLYPTIDGGNITVLHYLLTRENVNINIKGNDGYTLLHWACYNINRLPLDVFKFLIETNGSDVNAQDNNKNAPLHYALTSFNLNWGGDITALLYLLTQTDVNGNLKGKDGSILLHAACFNINRLPLEIFQYLIETMGCDVNIQDNNKDIPIYYAFQLLDPNKGGDIKVLTYLLRQNNLHTKRHNGQTFLHLACISNHPNSRNSVELNDAISCQIVEVIVETCIERVVDETIP